MTPAERVAFVLHDMFDPRTSAGSIWRYSVVVDDVHGELAGLGLGDAPNVDLRR